MANTVIPGAIRSISEIEAWARRAYEQLASEYYTHFHPNTRLFDKIIRQYLLSAHLTVESGSIHVEVGAGEGKLKVLPAFEAAQLILIDISSGMLENADLNQKYPNVFVTVASAFHLPLPDAICEGVYSILGDPYALPQYFREAHRILKTHGRLLYIGPTYVWGRTLRVELGIDVNLTEFKTRDGDVIQAPSFLYEPKEMEQLLVSAGFSRIFHNELRLPKKVRSPSVTPHILIPSRILRLDPYELPILDVYWAVK